MQKHTHLLFTLTFSLLTFLLAACGPSPTATPTPAAPTATPPATSTYTPAPTNTPPPATATFTPTPTPAIPWTPTPFNATEFAPPALQIISPTANQTVSVGEKVNVMAYAADNEGVARLEIYDDNALYNVIPAPLPASKALPILFTWTTNQIGKHVLRFIVYDTSNNPSAPVEIPVNVLTDARRPYTIILSPIGPQTTDIGEPFAIEAAATDETGVTRIDLFVDNQLYSYAASPNPQGQSPFTANFIYRPMTLGKHSYFIRAHDTGGQVDDSTASVLLVFDSSAPGVSTYYDHLNVAAFEPIVVTALAVDADGIARVELWADNEIVARAASPQSLTPTQTAFLTTLAWASNTPGDHVLFLRAFDANGKSADSPEQIIHVRRAGERPSSETPTIVLGTPTRTPRPTVTPPLAPPPAPSINVLQPTDHFAVTLPASLRFRVTAKAKAELDHLELWAYYQGETTAQVIAVLDAKGTTEKTMEFEWSPPEAGVVYLFAQVVDVYGQISKTPTLAGVIVSAPVPTITPSAPDIGGEWEGESDGSVMRLTLTQVGIALRGDLTLTRAGGEIVQGKIVSGSVNLSARVALFVDFAPMVLTIQYDCMLSDDRAGLECHYEDSTGAAGDAILTRVSP